MAHRYKKRADKDGVYLPGVGKLRDGQVVEGEQYARYCPQFLEPTTEAVTAGKAAVAPPPPPAPVPEPEVVELSSPEPAEAAFFGEDPLPEPEPVPEPEPSTPKRRQRRKKDDE